MRLRLGFTFLFLLVPGLLFAQSSDDLRQELEGILPAYLFNKISAVMLEIDEELQAKVQAYYDNIYQKIRVETDAVEPPTIVLVRTSNSEAFVVPKFSTNHVFVNVESLLDNRFEDLDAATFAHELQHFEPKQRERSGDSSNFFSEAEAEIEGVLKRLFRIGQADEAGDPEPSLYPFDLLIQDSGQSRGYSNTHLNRGHQAAILASVYGRERYRRSIPNESVPKPAIDQIRTQLAKARRRVEAQNLYFFDFDSNRSYAGRIADRVIKSPGRRWMESYEQMRLLLNQGEDLDQDQLEELLFQFEEWVSAQTRLDRAYAKNQRDFVRKNRLPRDNLPNEFFDTIDRTFRLLDSKSMIKEPLKEFYRGYDFRKYIQLENYFVSLTQEVISDPPGILLSEDFGHIETYVVRAFIAKHFQTIVAGVRSGAIEYWALLDLRWNAPELFTRRQLRALDRAVERGAKSLDREQLLIGLQNEKIHPSSLLALDRRAEGHRLSSDLRLAAIETLEPDEFSQIQFQLSKGDEKLIRFQLKRLASEPKYLSLLFQYLREAMAFLTDREIDEVFSGAIRSFELQWKESIDSIHLPDSFHEEFEELPGGGKFQSWWDVRTHLLKAIFQRNRDYRLFETFMSARREGDELPENFSPALLAQIETHLENFPKDIEWFSSWLEANNRNVNSARDRFPRIFAFTQSLMRERAIVVGHSILSLEPSKNYLRTDEETGNKSIEVAVNAIDWVDFFAELSLDEIFVFLSSNEHSRMARYHAKMIDGVYSRLAVLAENSKIPIRSMPDLYEGLAHRFKGSTPQSGVFFEKLKHFLLSQSGSDPLLGLTGISSNLFDSQDEFLEFVTLFVFDLLEINGLANRTASERREALTELTERLQRVLFRIDPLLVQQVFDRVSVRIKAWPSERETLQVDVDLENHALHQGIHIMNAVLSAFDTKFNHDQQWELLQWLRGRQSNLGENIVGELQASFLSRGVYVPIEGVEVYLRRRYDELSSSMKGSFFLILLSGRKGLLHEKKYLRKIEQELFAFVDRSRLKTTKEIYQAALNALPEALKNLVISIAFAESGRGGTPEQALRTIFSQMGPLIQKFGQNLAFDPNLPESFRRELQLLWDESSSLSWWKAQELLERQMGDLEANGVRLLSIENSGSTEAFVKVQLADGSVKGVFIQREQIQQSVETDITDLRAFVDYLVTHHGQKKYGFMKLLIEDSHRTIQQEMDTTYKSRIASATEKAYQDAILRLGGTDRINDWSFTGVEHSELSLQGGGQLRMVDIARGVPLKNIQDEHPELYREVSELILRVESEILNDESAPVDKDRMPGQYFIDIENRTITYLDPGQSKFVDPAMRQISDQFMLSSFVTDGRKIADLMIKLKISIPKSKQALMSLSLVMADEQLRPLQALNWVYTNGFITEANEDQFFDLVHVIRAKLRLAHWAGSLGIEDYADEWRDRAGREVLPIHAKVTHRCLRGLRDARRRLRSAVPIR